MKQFSTSLVLLALLVGAAGTSTTVFAQGGAPLGTRKLVLDDNQGHAMTIQPPLPFPAYNLNPVYTIAVPPAGNPPAGFAIAGSLNNTQFWDGQVWQNSTVLLNDNTNVSLGGALVSGARFTLQGQTSNSTTGALNVLNSGGGTSLYVRNDKRFGISTLSPGAPLGVNGNMNVGAGYASTTGQTDGMIVQGEAVTGTSVTPSNTFSVAGNASVGSSYGGSNAAPSNGLLVQGNVGIGTNSPGAALDVQSSGYAGSFYGGGSNPVLEVRTASTSDDHNVKYVTFSDASDDVRGTIEGQSGTDVLSSEHYIASTAFLACYGVALGLSAGDLEPGTAIEMTGLIAAYTIDQATIIANLGITYTSSAGDYAEWLPKLDNSERIAAGDVVGVFGGKISKKTEGAQQVFAISTAPAVLGNTPDKSDEVNYRKVAFLGQVPVKVRGVVHVDDYIVASGVGDGYAYAVNPNQIKPAEFGLLVGRAWSASNTEGLKYVKVAVGLNSGKIAGYTQKQDAEIATLKSQIDGLKSSASELHQIEAKIKHLEDSSNGIHETTYTR